MLNVRQLLSKPTLDTRNTMPACLNIHHTLTNLPFSQNKYHAPMYESNCSSGLNKFLIRPNWMNGLLLASKMQMLPLAWQDFINVLKLTIINQGQIIIFKIGVELLTKKYLKNNAKIKPWFNFNNFS